MTTAGSKMVTQGRRIVGCYLSQMVARIQLGPEIMVKTAGLVLSEEIGGNQANRPAAAARSRLQ
jgi:hypothetical protein